MEKLDREKQEGHARFGPDLHRGAGRRDPLSLALQLTGDVAESGRLRPGSAAS